MNETIKAKIYKDFKMITTFYEERGLNLRGHFGTLLGAVREAGLIPWDDDIDLFIFEEELSLFKKISKELYLQKNIKINFSSLGAFHFENNESNEKYFIDVFVMFKVKKRISFVTRSKIYLTLAKRKTYKEIMKMKFRKDIFMGLIVKTFSLFLPITKDYEKGIHNRLKDEKSNYYAVVSNPLWYSTSIVTKKELGRNKKIAFGDGYLWAFENNEYWLNNLYGKNWRTPQKWRDHDNF